MTLRISRNVFAIKAGLFALVAIGIAFTLQSSPAAAQSSCQGKSKSQCESSPSCSWVSGYKTQAGASVKSYCRGKSAKGAAKRKAAKAKADAKKKSGKAKAEAKKAKGKKKSAKNKKKKEGKKSAAEAKETKPGRK